MTTISVPIKTSQEKFLEEYVKSGKADNKAQVVRRALKEFEDAEAVRAILEAEKEPNLKGDLDTLAKKLGSH
jgi:Arc/MetJ-type ribon-helix-helix transcriptional regulator